MMKCFVKLKKIENSKALNQYVAILYENIMSHLLAIIN